LKKILFINPFGIGDVIFTTALIRAVKDAWPESYLGYWCNERTRDLFKHDPDINKVLGLSRGDLKKVFERSILEGLRQSLGLFREIKKERFDAALDFSLDHRYGLVAKLAGIKRRIGLDYRKRGRFLTEKITIDGYEEKHVVEYYLELLKFLDLRPKDNKLYVPVTDRMRTGAGLLLGRYGIGGTDILAGIAPGAGGSWGTQASIKHWSAIKYAKLADRIMDEFGAKVLILGDESERPIAEVIAHAMRNRPIDLVGRTSLDDLIAVINRLKVLVTNDGGPLHIGVATGIKTVSIFGPVDERVYGPYPASERHAVVKSDIACRPCYRKFRMPVCDRDRECINIIGVDEVFQAVRRLW